MTDDNLIRVLERLDAWLEANAPADFAALNPPAAQGDISKIGEYLIDLHRDVVTWLRWHDGAGATTGPSLAGFLLPGGYAPLAAKDMDAGQRDMERKVAWSLDEEDEDEIHWFTVAPGHELDIVGDGMTVYSTEDLGLVPAPTTCHIRWVPFASSTESGHDLIVDHRRGPTHGAVRRIEPEAVDPSAVVWPDVTSMFTSLIDALETARPITVGTVAYIPRVLDGALDWEIVR
ncbi:hypothetical protein [Streptomyces sp. PanSC9]|uniref:hypothetical protein n=1 Tax=Streptomyces sp. PanSC9 TaxID=1520461 RepID=UPI000F497DDB|nr:hypothetical protein [Streptomyces sp. PanSC9]ROP44210.1 cell wall assembly regulator SMI1 [Streptomyces sp. PanSC9]